MIDPFSDLILVAIDVDCDNLKPINDELEHGAGVWYHPLQSTLPFNRDHHTN